MPCATKTGKLYLNQEMGRAYLGVFLWILFVFQSKYICYSPCGVPSVATCEVFRHVWAGPVTP
jgi:hypothetical protein